MTRARARATGRSTPSPVETLDARDRAVVRAPRLTRTSSDAIFSRTRKRKRTSVRDVSRERDWARSGRSHRFFEIWRLISQQRKLKKSEKKVAWRRSVTRLSRDNRPRHETRVSAACGPQRRTQAPPTRARCVPLVIPRKHRKTTARTASRTPRPRGEALHFRQGSGCRALSKKSPQPPPTRR